MSYSYIRHYYDVPVMRGVRITYGGKLGVITGTSNSNLLIWLDEQRDKDAKSKGYTDRRYRMIVHPKDSYLVYLPTTSQVARCDKLRRKEALS